MTHIEHQQRASLYIDTALNDKESSELFAHLAECDQCRAFMNISMRMHAHLAGEELADVPQSLDRRVVASVARETTARTRKSWYSPVWFTRISIPLPAAASIVFLLIVGSLLCVPFLSRDQQQPPAVPAELMSKVPPSLQRAF